MLKPLLNYLKEGGDNFKREDIFDVVSFQIEGIKYDDSNNVSNNNSHNNKNTNNNNSNNVDNKENYKLLKKERVRIIIFF